MIADPAREAQSSNRLLSVMLAVAGSCALLLAVAAYTMSLPQLLRSSMGFSIAYLAVEYLNRRSKLRINFKPIVLSVISLHCLFLVFASGLPGVQPPILLVSMVLWLLMYHDPAKLRLIGASHLLLALLAVYVCDGEVYSPPWLRYFVVTYVCLTFAVASSFAVRSNRAYWRRMELLELELSEQERSLELTTAQLALQNQALRRTTQEQRELAGDNAERVERLRLAYAEQSQIAQAASSDLRQPLRNINSFVQLIGRRLVTLGMADTVKDYLDFVTDGTTRMNQMVDDLLRYSESHSPADPVAVDTAETMRSIRDNLSNLFDRENGHLTFDEHLPVISGQPTQVLQLFQNLISNGIKFKRAGVAPACHVACEVADGVARFSVSDNGIGIPASRLQDVFGLFTRLHERGAYEGTGIGLATCRRIVMAAGGTIWAESTEGEGTTFVFTWPLSSGVDASPATGRIRTPRAVLTKV